MRRDCLVLEAKNDFDQACDPCSRLTVPNVGFHGAYDKGLRRITAFGVDLANREHFDRITFERVEIT
jgi:hypothetical protein